MNKVTEDLKKIVDEVARGGALTAQAVKQFDDMRSSLETIERELEQVKRQRDSLHDDLRKLTKEKEFIETALKVRIEDCDRYAARELDFNRMAWLYQHEVDRRLDMRGIVSEVFKNFETAREFTKVTPVPMTSGGNTWVQDHVTVERTAERHKKEGT
jgi:hypothetical protein